MHKLYTIVACFIIVAVSLLINQPSAAVSQNIVISQIQLGDTASATNEFVELYNNSLSDVDITGWCLYYASASSIQNGSKLTCFSVDNDNIHLYLPSQSFAFTVSSQLAAYLPMLESDLRFSATLSGTAGHIRIVDKSGLEIDKVGWGASAVSAEGNSPIAAAPAGKLLSRKTSSAGVLQDTDINSQDFEIVPQRAGYLFGSIYEVQDLCSNIGGVQTTIPDGYDAIEDYQCYLSPIDVCTNIDGLQAVIPNGYGLDESGYCQTDICTNLDGVQLELPSAMDIDGVGNCVTHDECSNLPEIQPEIPADFVRGDEDSCSLSLLPLQITELLPNASGSDYGNEFIEIYNPNSIDVGLSYYFLYIGSDSDHLFSFPASSIIKAGEYRAFSNNEINFTLVNTASSIQLHAIDGTIQSISGYSSPGDDMAWALIEGVWQYTNQPTPGNANLPSLLEFDGEVLSGSILQPCAANQYRNPETNRCKLINTAESVLAPCKDGQYRSEETNRCRSIASDANVLEPCQEGYERNSETNRCRKISDVLGASDLTPCKDGYERNPDTNRCRKIMSSDIPSADYAPEKTNGSLAGSIIWWSLAGVGVAAIGYAIWEWRFEIKKLIKKIVKK